MYVLISIQPQWCSLIKYGSKIWEIRKNKPILQPPFKCLVYETKGKNGEGAGKIIGEFVCDRIVEIGYSPYNHGEYICDVENIHRDSCVDFATMFDYLADGMGYAWHISELFLYDNPKAIQSFQTYCNCKDCEKCQYHSWDYVPCSDEKELVCTVSQKKPLSRAPQSWCYVC